jgi:hypothetical protein
LTLAQDPDHPVLILVRLLVAAQTRSGPFRMSLALPRSKSGLQGSVAVIERGDRGD